MAENNAARNSVKPDVMDCVMRLAGLTRRYWKSGSKYSRSEAKLLHILQQFPDKNASEIAALLDIRPSSLSEVLDRMMQRGLIERRLWTVRLPGR